MSACPHTPAKKHENMAHGDPVPGPRPARSTQFPEYLRPWVEGKQCADEFHATVQHCWHLHDLEVPATPSLQTGIYVPVLPQKQAGPLAGIFVRRGLIPMPCATSDSQAFETEMRCRERSCLQRVPYGFRRCRHTQSHHLSNICAHAEAKDAGVQSSTVGTSCLLWAASDAPAVVCDCCCICQLPEVILQLHG